MMGGSEAGWPIQAVKAACPPERIGAAFRQRLPGIKADYGVPRDGGAMADYLVASVPAGRYAIYGAGTLGRQVFEALAHRPGVDIRAFIDKRAQEIGAFCGRPVVAIDTFSDAGLDGVIVAHQHAERAMVAALQRRGVAGGRIHPVFTNPAFARWFAGSAGDTLATAWGQGIRHLIVSVAEPTWSLLSDAELVDLLPPDETLHVFFGNSTAIAHQRLDTVYPVVDARMSLRFLDAIVEQTQPLSIYVKVSAHHAGVFLGAYLKTRFPACVVVEEMYDQALMLGDAKLAQGYGGDADDAGGLRIVELAAMHLCDLVLTKNGGDAWDNARAGLAAPHHTYFPRITDATAAQSDPWGDQPGDPNTLVFAGTLPVPQPDGGLGEHRDMRYVEMIRRMAPSRRLRIDLFNGADRFAEQAGLYDAYRQAFGADGPICYHPALPLGDMRRILPTYGYAWHVMHDGTAGLVEPVSRVGVGNKFTTYLAAGLPVLIDSDYEFMAGLVREYAAGLVVPPDTLPGLEATLATLDHTGLRRGVRALTAMMAANNRKVLDDLAVALTSAPAKGTGAV